MINFFNMNFFIYLFNSNNYFPPKQDKNKPADLIYPRRVSFNILDFPTVSHELDEIFFAIPQQPKSVGGGVNQRALWNPISVFKLAVDKKTFAIQYISISPALVGEVVRDFEFIYLQIIFDCLLHLPMRQSRWFKTSSGFFERIVT